MQEQELRDQLAQAQEELRQLKELFTPKIVFPLAWRLSIAESRILSSLYKFTSGMPVSTAALHSAVGTHRFDDEPTEPKIVQVYICKMRPKLAPFGIKIETIWGRGYVLTKSSREIITEALAPQQQAA